MPAAPPSRTCAGATGNAYRCFGTYTVPYLDRPNLTVLPGALVTRLTFEGTRASGVEVLHGGALRRVAADAEVVLSLGAIHTPKVLMQSGLGDEAELRRVGVNGAPAFARGRTQFSGPLRNRLRVGVSGGRAGQRPSWGDSVLGLRGGRHPRTGPLRVSRTIREVHARKHRKIWPAAG